MPLTRPGIASAKSGHGAARLARLWGRLLWLALAAGWMGLLFYYSSRTSTGIGLVESATGDTQSLVLRKFAHAVAYGVLALLLRWALGSWRGGRGAYVVALALTVAYAISDEVHQHYVPGRVGAPTDVGYDVLGAVVALAGWRLIEVTRPAAAAARWFRATVARSNP